MEVSFLTQTLPEAAKLCQGGNPALEDFQQKFYNESMKRLSVFLASALFSLILFVSPALAADEFETSYQTTYLLKENETVLVNQKISLTNKLANIYPTEYLLEIEGVEIKDVKATDGAGEITPLLEKGENSFKIKLKFNQKVVGEGNILSFNLSYQALNILVKNGEVWEVNLPQMPDLENLADGTLILVVPKSFGPLAYITPDVFKASADDYSRYYTFKRGKTSLSGISAAFGEFQIFDFDLKYHLHNPGSSRAKTLVAFPPDTSFQRVYFKKIQPPPQKMITDQDGNWLGLYFLDNGQRITIAASGSVKIFSQPQEFYSRSQQETIEMNLLPQKYWETDNPEIIVKARELQSAKKIYQFVTKFLSYDYSKVEKETERKGALQALKNPDSSICMEFTDLFVALCRAAGIPAREINGFAYTTNTRLKPLSLVIDVLHSWPEYWDSEKQIWVPVDPTWEKTTGGRDYFSRSDLNHFVFAIHGLNSQFPLPAGAYKTGTEVERDVRVEFGQYQPFEMKNLQIEFIPPKISFHRFSQPKIIITNPGPASRYGLTLIFDSSKAEIHSGFSKKQTIEAIPPFGKKEISVQLARPKIFQFGQASLKLSIDEEEFTFPFRTETLIWPQFLIVSAGACLGILGFLILKKIWTRKSKTKLID